ncbi:MAG: hypothetical protein JSU81_03200 [Candidatus Coatesbacteria bacterium]|nr:MAG: hypothetical protein JSU81_03200 [Candidatus Coatesbacteria bacterium]
MKKAFAVVLFVPFVLAGCSDVAGPDDPKRDPVRAFYGQVYANNEGVSGAKVTVNCTDCGEAGERCKWEAETNATGYWQAKDRPPIDHMNHILNCTAEKEGYKPDDLRCRVPEAGPVEVPAFRLAPK